MTMIISGSDGLEFPDGSDQATAFTGNAATITSGTIATARLATGTANSSTYLRGDQTWAAVPAATPGGSTTQVQFNNAGAFGGSANLTFNGTTLVATDITDSSLTPGQVVFPTTGGNLTGSSNLFWDSANARLGIGTASPSGRIDVVGTTSSTEVRTIATTGLTSFRLVNTGGVAGLFIDNSAASSFGKGAYSRNLYSDGAYPVCFWTNDAERMRIASDGNVGVGTTSTSAARLTVRGAGTTSSTASLELATSGGATRLYVRDDGATSFYGSSNAETMRIDASGNLLFNSGYGSAGTAYGCRAWVKFSGSTGSINGSGNVSSVSDNGTGNFTVNFSSAMPDTNYAWNGTADPTSGQTSDGAVKCVFGRPDTNPTTSAIALLTCSSGFGRDDFESVFVTVHR
jgi:hypothetical protein